MRELFLALGGLSIALTFASITSAQSYPNKPIRVLASEVGGGGDFHARLIAPELAAALGQPVVVANGPGVLIPDMVAKANPDGYTVAVIANSAWITPLIRKTTYDPIKDISPVTMLTATPLVVVVHPSVPVNSIKELIVAAKAKPGAFNYASAPAGTLSHLGAELLWSMAGVNVVRVPFKGSGPGLVAVIGGEVHFMVSNSDDVMPHVKAGRLKALAVTSAKPSPLIAGLPTVAETLPGYEFIGLFGVLTTAGTPASVIGKLNQEIVRVLNRSEVKQSFLKVGSEVVGSSAEQFSATIKSDMVKLGKVIQDAGIRAD